MTHCSVKSVSEHLIKALSRRKSKTVNMKSHSPKERERERWNSKKPSLEPQSSFWDGTFSVIGFFLLETRAERPVHRAARHTCHAGLSSSSSPKHA
jgi:hypothetical protein